MGNMTLSVPERLHSDMRKFSEIRWSEVARKAIAEKVEALKMAEDLSKKSKLTKKDVEELSRKIKNKATRRFLS